MFLFVIIFPPPSGITEEWKLSSTRTVSSESSLPAKKVWWIFLLGPILVIQVRVVWREQTKLQTLLKAGSPFRSVSLANYANGLIMLAKGSPGWPELIMAFKEDGQFFTSCKSPMAYQPILGITLLACLCPPPPPLLSPLIRRAIR